MTVPAEPALHVEAVLMGKPGHDVLDGPSQDVSVVRQAGGEGRPVVEREPAAQTHAEAQLNTPSPQHLSAISAVKRE